jgi:hypothetical protein
MKLRGVGDMFGRGQIQADTCPRFDPRIARRELEIIRDEELQARELSEILVVLDGAGVEGVFVCGFAEPLSPRSEDPRYDLDMSALGLVAMQVDEHGTTYPDIAWEPKRAFHAVADFYGARAGAAGLQDYAGT